MKSEQRLQWTDYCSDVLLLLKVRLKVDLYTATYMNMTSSGLQCEVAY